jgi:hypothetical protein
MSKSETNLKIEVRKPPVWVFPFRISSLLRISRFGFRISMLLALTGCGGPQREFAEVEGKVTLNKKPLAGAMVRFYPISAGREQLPYASGITDSAGRYALTRQGDRPGAVVGPNRAVVSWPSRDLLGVGRDGPAPSPPGPPIPMHYTVASETPLILEVKGGGPQTIDLPLED